MKLRTLLLGAALSVALSSTVFAHCSSAMEENTSSALKVQSCCSAPSGCCEEPSQTVHEGLSSLLSKHNVNDYAASVKVYAVKQ